MLLIKLQSSTYRVWARSNIHWWFVAFGSEQCGESWWHIFLYFLLILVLIFELLLPLSFSFSLFSTFVWPRNVATTITLFTHLRHIWPSVTASVVRDGALHWDYLSTTYTVVILKMPSNHNAGRCPLLVMSPSFPRHVLAQRRSAKQHQAPSWHNSRFLSNRRCASHLIYGTVVTGQCLPSSTAANARYEP